MESRKDVEYCFSDLTYLESIIKPLRTGDQATRQLFELFFERQSLLNISRAVFEAAAKLRAEFPNLKTPDALHLATASYHACEEFWTNDNRLNKIAPSIIKNILTDNFHA